MSSTQAILSQRGRALFHLSSSMILDWDDSEPETAHALRYGILVLRKPSGYFRCFEGSSLLIDASLIDRFIRLYSPWIPGSTFLMLEEVDIIQKHNLHVNNLTEQFPEAGVVLTLKPDLVGTYIS